VARTPRIRFTENDRREFSRLVKNTKSKISRVEGKYGESASRKIREAIEIPDSLEEFTNRKAFERWKNKMSEVTNRSNPNFQFVQNENGVVATKQEIKEITKLNEQARKLTEEENKRIGEKPFFVGGKQFGTVEQQKMRVERDRETINQIAKFDFDSVKDEKELEYRKEVAEKRADPKYYSTRKETMKRNFIEQVNMSFNSDADELVELLVDIPAEDFYEMYHMFAEFDFSDYDSEGNYIGAGDPTAHVERLKGYVERYFRNGLDMDLKDF
jgi:hypothetical protein